MLHQTPIIKNNMAMSENPTIGVCTWRSKGWVNPLPEGKSTGQNQQSYASFAKHN